MKDWIVRQANQPRSGWAQVLVLIPAAAIFPFLLPWGMMVLGRKIDGWLGIAALSLPPVNAILGGILIAVGLPLALWTIIAQLTRGHGTPVPIVATQKLIIEPPYTLCRNPMVLGTLMAYLGLAVIIGSPGTALVVAVFGALLLFYVKRIEEQEMLERFGADYEAYRKRTPFLIPRI